MKKFFLITITILACCFNTACSSDDSNGTNILTLESLEGDYKAKEIRGFVVKEVDYNENICLKDLPSSEDINNISSDIIDVKISSSGILNWSNKRANYEDEFFFTFNPQEPNNIKIDLNNDSWFWHIEKTTENNVYTLYKQYLDIGGWHDIYIYEMRKISNN